MALIGGTMVTWLENTVKLRDVAGSRLQQGKGRRRCGGLEADCEKDHLALRVVDRDPQGVQRRVHEPDVGALGLGLQQVALAARHPHHVAERGEDDPGLLGHGDGIVDPAHGDHAYRTAGPVHQLDGGGQDVLDPVPVDRVGVTSAHLHELELVVARQFA